MMENEHDHFYFVNRFEIHLKPIVFHGSSEIFALRRKEYIDMKCGFTRRKFISPITKLNEHIIIWTIVHHKMMIGVF
jgi:hypothetical protein